MGLNLFVIHGIISPRGGTLQEVVMGSLPFVVIMTMFLVILCFFPGLATWLPKMMM